MPSDAAITNATTMLFTKAPLAIWLVLLAMRFVDRRVNTAGQRALLAIAGALICVSNAWSDFQSQNFPEAANSALTAESTSVSTQDWSYWGWSVAGAFFALQVVLAIRTWLKTSPSEKHAAEKSDGNPKSKKGSDDSVSPIHFFELILGVSGLAVLAYLVWDVFQSIPFGHTNTYRAAIFHLYTTIGMLSISLFCALEITLLLSPDTINRRAASGKFLVRCQLVSWIAQVLFLGKLILTTFVLLKLGDTESVDIKAQVLAASFAIGLMILDFVGWMVPYRLRIFQRGTTPTGWASLSLASWLCVLAYGVISVLPFDWPWKLFWQ